MIKENIDNLTNLWQVVGKNAKSFYVNSEFSYCFVNYSEWPNRLWFSTAINDKNLEQARNIMLNIPVTLKVSHWEFLDSNSELLFKKHGFIKLSEQFGMSLKLYEKYESDSFINLHKVTNEDEALLWSDLFQKAFNYHISDVLVLHSRHEIDYFIAYHDDQAVGTCMLYSNSNDIVGFHSMGIIPEMRRRGYAEEIIKQMLSQSIVQGFKYATLQASEMAKPLYEKYGFDTQFIMKNYQLNI
ncbi:MAG: GNAT family N-acetyltransferase [Bacteroidetes bacterium]|nr:GNAT family N-acetyltransferase [Bacteroidota bacterium]